MHCSHEAQYSVNVPLIKGVFELCAIAYAISESTFTILMILESSKTSLLC